MPKLQYKVKTVWCPNLAYAIGLIASDGYLSSDQRHIGLVSKDLELVENLRTALVLKNKIGRRGRGGEKAKNYYCVNFGDKNFYVFLNTIGLTNNKSKTIREVAVPDKFFCDFLRGLFDGDGTFYTYWDKRWPRSFGFKLSFASASPVFVGWLKQKLARLYTTRGYVHKGAGVLNLEYNKGDSKRLYHAMYDKDVILYGIRKYNKLNSALEIDAKVGLDYLQKPRIVKAGVAQW